MMPDHAPMQMTTLRDPCVFALSADAAGSIVRAHGLHTGIVMVIKQSFA